MSPMRATGENTSVSSPEQQRVEEDPHGPCVCRLATAGSIGTSAAA